MPFRNLTRPARFIPLLLGAAVALTACFPSHPQSTFDAAGPVAADQRFLFYIIFWAAVVVFVLVEGALIYSIIRYRQRHAGEMPAQIHGNTKLEVTWTIIPALLLLFVAIPTVRIIYTTHEPPSSAQNPLNVTVVGHQWWFEFRYPDLEIVTANELHIPTGRAINITLESDDVIHSFWVPKLAGKVDLVPNNVNRMWFQADEPDEYLGQCAEFCGIAHALMRFRVYAEAPDAFEDWLAGMRRPPEAPEGDSAQAGRSLFLANCSMCHTVDSYRAGGFDSELTVQAARKEAWLDDPEGAARIPAPNLTHFGQRATLGAGLKDQNRDNLIAWITDPASVKRGTRMKEVAAIYDGDQIKLSAEQVAQIADYLLSLTPGAVVEKDTEPAEVVGEVDGEALFKSNGCSGCHSTGSDRIVGPGLAGVGERAATRKPPQSADEYLLESIINPSAFLVPEFANVMPAGFSSLSGSERDALIKYLKTLR